MLCSIARSFLTRLTATVFLVGLPVQAGDGVDRSVESAVPFYIASGDRVEARYETYRRLLRTYHDALLEAARMRAPELLARIQEPEPLRRGYGVLPTLVHEPAPATAAPAQAAAYSWPWTEQMIDREGRELLRSLFELEHRQSRAVVEKQINEYPDVRDRHRIIDAHIRYNRFWQAAIAADRAAYDRETALQERALTYQRIVGVLQAVATRASVAIPQSFGEALSSYAERLKETIAAALHRVERPHFVAVERCDDGWTVRVPVFTDIEEKPFVAAVKRIIESAWQVEGTQRIRVQLDVSYIAPASLYGDAAEPRKGAPIDLRDHLARFPPESAILTTGGLTTHVRRHAIVLGPGTVSPRLLAHEFGHILGFRDAYIRGYRDLHESGFQVRELVVLPDDIMAASPTGRVKPSHFQRLVDSSKTERCAPQPGTAKL